MDELVIDNPEDVLYRYHEIRYSLGIDEYDDPLPGYTLKIELSKFRVIKRTPKGAWISLYGLRFADKKFVLLTAVKQYASETKEKAMESFIARKRRQIEILGGQLAQAERALQLGERYAAKGIIQDSIEDNLIW